MALIMSPLTKSASTRGVSVVVVIEELRHSCPVKSLRSLGPSHIIHFAMPHILHFFFLCHAPPAALNAFYACDAMRLASHLALAPVSRSVWFL